MSKDVLRPEDIILLLSAEDRRWISFQQMYCKRRNVARKGLESTEAFGRNMQETLCSMHQATMTTDQTMLLTNIASILHEPMAAVEKLATVVHNEATKYDYNRSRVNDLLSDTITEATEAIQTAVVEPLAPVNKEDIEYISSLVERLDMEPAFNLV